MLIELTFTQSALVCCVFERERENDSEEVRTSDFFFFFLMRCAVMWAKDNFFTHQREGLLLTQL